MDIFRDIAIDNIELLMEKYSNKTVRDVTRIALWGSVLPSLSTILFWTTYFIIRELISIIELIEFNKSIIISYGVSLLLYAGVLWVLLPIATKKMSMENICSRGLKFYIFIVFIIIVLGIITGVLLVILDISLSYVMGENFVSAEELSRLSIGFIGSVSLVLTAIGKAKQK